jgi:uncharacterized OB-fold protein
LAPTHHPTPSSTTALVGSRCADCGNVAFPAAATACQRCGARVTDTLELSRRGVVWAYTVQRFPPKSPPYVPPAEGFTPFAVGYVELPEGVKVEALLDSLESEDLADADVTLVAVDPVPRFATNQLLAGAS